MIKIGHGHPILYASNVLSIFDSGQKRIESHFVLIFRWSGVNQKKHFDDCYFCAVNTKGINAKNGNSLVYSNLKSAIRPIPHCNEIPVPVFKGLPELEFIGSEEGQASIFSTDSSEDIALDVGFPPSSLPQLFSQGELNDLTKDLNLF